MEKPTVWQMITEAVNQMNGKIYYSDIKGYINGKWPGVNQFTITAQIIALTVNHKSRIHYPDNPSPRLTNSGSHYDLLYTIGRGLVEKYDIQRHGVWEIVLNKNNKLEVVKSLVGQIYTPADIKWIKNVTNSEIGKAYFDLQEDNFILHYPTIHEGNILKPQIGELIVLRQKIESVAVFTHLVTPVDNELIDSKERSAYQFGRKVRVIAFTNMNTIKVSQTKWSNIKSSGFTQGNACKIENISSVENLDALQLDTWEHFKPYFLPAEQASVELTTALKSEIENSGSTFYAEEGGLKLITHLVRERNRSIVNEKKKRALEMNRLHCEVCEFSFNSVYNANYIECHHLTPISTPGVKQTTLEDLALVCANCHRMLHMRFDGEFLGIDKLRERLEWCKGNELE